MNKNILLAAILGASVLALSPLSASADPVGLRVTIQCPGIAGNQNVITNFGDYVGGSGMEIMDNQNPFPVYFKSVSLAPNTPADLSNYNNQSARYDSTKGSVSCAYTSSNLSEPALSVSYALTNGKGGAVTGSDQASVSFVLPVGRRNS